MTKCKRGHKVDFIALLNDDDSIMWYGAECDCASTRNVWASRSRALETLNYIIDLMDKNDRLEAELNNASHTP